MIRNLIFDLGNVLLSWKPEEYLLQNGYSASERSVILNDVFRSREWHLLDNGDITLDEAADSISERSSLSRQEIRAVFDLRTKILYPLDSNIKMLPALKEQGFKLYFLSNFPGDIFNEVRDKYSFFDFFDGGIVSAYVNASKPDRRIFEILIDKYSLSPEQCLFIDDLEPNVLTAEAMGMTGIWLYDPPDLSGLVYEKLKTNY